MVQCRGCWFTWSMLFAGRLYKTGEFFFFPWNLVSWESTNPPSKFETMSIEPPTPHPQAKKMVGSFDYGTTCTVLGQTATSRSHHHQYTNKITDNSVDNVIRAWKAVCRCSISKGNDALSFVPCTCWWIGLLKTRSLFFLKFFGKIGSLLDSYQSNNPPYRSCKTDMTIPGWDGIWLNCG